jgi:probable DNA repair protein
MDALWAEVAAGATLVTGTRRLARSLTLEHHRAQRAAGRNAWPTPAILSWNEWLRSLWTEAATAGAPGCGARLLGPAETILVWEEILRASDDGREADVNTLAPRLARTRELATNWQIDTGLLAAHARTVDTERFVGWHAAYLALLARSAWTDLGAVPALLGPAIDRKGLPPRKLLALSAGEWPPARHAFLRRLAAAGWTVQDTDTAPPPGPPGQRSQRLSCATPADEFERAARWARAQREAGPQRRIAIVVPDLEQRLPLVRRQMLDVCWPDWRLEPAANLPVNFSASGPLAGTGLVREALLVLRLLGDEIDLHEACWLLRSPYACGHAEERDARGELEFRLRRLAPPRLGRAALAAYAAGTAPRFSAALLAVDALAQRGSRHDDLESWLVRFQTVLAAWGWPGERSLQSDEYQALIAWVRLGEELRRGTAVCGAVSWSRALALVERAARGRSFQPAAHPDAIQVLGLLESLGQHFDALWVTGLDANHWPAAGRPDPFLPIDLQRQAGLPEATPAAGLAQATRRLERLLGSAAQVIVSHAASDGDEPLDPSPLIAGMPAVTWDELPAWRGTSPWQVARVELPLQDDAPPAYGTGRRLPGGIRVLADQAACPARAFLAHRLGAQELEQPAVGLDARTRGQITHEALAGIFLRVPDSAALAALGAGELDALLDECLAAALGNRVREHSGLRAALLPLERQRQRQLLARFLALERERDAFQVIVVEGSPGDQELPPAVRALGLGLKADRVDRLGNGERLVVDYKTGSRRPNPRDLERDRLVEPQLPLYALAANADAVAWVQLHSRELRWVTVGREQLALPGGPARRSANSRSWQELRAHWQRTLNRHAEEFLAGDFRINQWQRDPAADQWAMATRLYDSVAAADADEEETE